MNAFEAVLASEFQAALKKDVLFKFLTIDKSLLGKTILYTMVCPDSLDNGELSFVRTLIDYHHIDHMWSLGLTINSKNVVHIETRAKVAQIFGSGRTTVLSRTLMKRLESSWLFT